MVSRVPNSIFVNRCRTPNRLDAYRRFAAMAVLGLSILLIAGCAGSDTTAYRADEPDPQTTEALPAPAVEDGQAISTGSGPVNLALVGKSDTAGIPTEIAGPAPVKTAAATDTSGRMAFLEWFGSSADRARVHSPTDELRKSREFTSGQEPPSELAAGPQALDQPFAISNNSRLVPTYSDGLPGVEHANKAPGPLEAGQVDITGSVTARQQSDQIRPLAVKKTPVATEPTAPVKHDATAPEAEMTLREPAKTPVQRQASVDAAPEPDTGVDLPSRDNPVRLHIERGVPRFNEQEQKVLAGLAALQVKTGLNVHIRGIARGISGDRQRSTMRVKRLHAHANRAIAVLAHHGVPRSRITITTAEQRMTGIDLGSFSTADEDRLDFSLE